MIFKKAILLYSFLLISCCLLKAQSIQLFTEDFQSGGTSFTINGAGPGSAMGSNQWIINNQYSGVPTYPTTMRQDSTYSGTIGSAPYSSYLHIHDAPSAITNCNYNPANPSDRFAYMTDGLCTLGMDSVHFSFFYLSEGSPTAYGKVYYSADNGPWIQIGLTQYNNKYKWKYEDITNPAFSNVGNLRFGFRWENDNGTSPNSVAFAIDDINIVASYDLIDPVTISIDSVSPSSVCQGTYLTIYYTISDTLCNGTYEIELSNSSGTFPSSFTTWVTTISYPQTTGIIGIQLPNGATPGLCYKIRISRNAPPPLITGIASACFVIEDCPNVITTMQPVVTMDTNAVCIGSAIDIPFASTGVYTFNTYTAQLSDSNGTFPATPVVVGTFVNSGTYDPALGTPPGSVSGQVPIVPPGCDYYIRIVSSNPVATGSQWGPFCIGECDITTNNKMDLSYCVGDCSVSPLGLNSLIPIDVNTYDDTAVYSPGNLFTTQLMSSMTFAQIGSNGILGAVAAVDDTTLNIHIPCKDSLPIIGVPIGMNYMRIVGTNSSEPDNTLGSLIRVTIGAIRSTPQIIDSYDYGADYDFTLPYPWKPMKDTFCSGETVMLMFTPYSYSDMSTYKWICSGINGGNPFVSPSGANSNELYVNLGGPGILTFKIQETSYGCVGPWSPVDSVVVLGPPNVLITGPSIVCQGDTNLFQVPFSDNTYYTWTSNNGTIIDTSNNEIDIKFPTTPGSHSITINSINQCGSASATKTIQVKPYPTVNAGNDTIVCINEPVSLSTNSGVGYSYSWSDGTSVISSTQSTSVAPITTTSYTVTVTGTGGCVKKDSVTIQIQSPLTVTYADSLCPNGDYSITLAADTLGTEYLWNNGGGSAQQISVADTGTYILTVNFTNAVCPKIETFNVKPDACPVELTLPNVFSPNGDGYNDFFIPIPLGEFDIYNIDKFEIKIYSRWGQLLFESTDSAFKWNGNNKGGKPVSDGVYYYIAEITSKSDKPKSLTGFVTLTR
ncbi:MAG: gliding motility-associated C-terminal domain-containing protein [Bacteroidia bacterium]|nr:gliding motility-associated C-terminal domain-containing protein [Bacteroidia bacterium]